MRVARSSARNAEPPTTVSPIASLTTSSKRDMCAPFCCGPRSTKHSSLAWKSCSAPGAPMRMTFSTPVTPTRDSESLIEGVRFWTSGACERETGSMAVVLPADGVESRVSGIGPSLCYQSRTFPLSPFVYEREGTVAQGFRER